MSGLLIGLVAGVVCFWACTTLKAKLGYDDSLDVFGIHGVGGTVGAILTGVFAAEGLLGGNAGQIVNQLGAVAVTWIFAIVMTLIIAKVTDAVIGLRVSQEDEMAGLDLSQHGESGYNLEEAM